MKLVSAVLAPSALDAVTAALAGLGVPGLTVAQVSGYGREMGHTEIYRGAELTVDLLPKVLVEVLVELPHVSEVVETIARAAWTGSVGDGKVWVTEAETIMRIRTGEQGVDAL